MSVKRGPSYIIHAKFREVMRRYKAVHKVTIKELAAALDLKRGVVNAMLSTRLGERICKEPGKIAGKVGALLKCAEGEARSLISLGTLPVAPFTWDTQLPGFTEAGVAAPESSNAPINLRGHHIDVPVFLAMAIKMYMAISGVSPKRLGELAKLSKYTISDIAAGTTKRTSDASVTRICNCTGLPADAVLDERLREERMLSLVADAAAAAAGKPRPVIAQRFKDDESAQAPSDAAPVALAPLKALSERVAAEAMWREAEAVRLAAVAAEDSRLALPENRLESCVNAAEIAMSGMPNTVACVGDFLQHLSATRPGALWRDICDDMNMSKRLRDQYATMPALTDVLYGSVRAPAVDDLCRVLFRHYTGVSIPGSEVSS